MQIRLSWQLLGAILIFLIALALITRSLVGRGEGAARPTPERATSEAAIAAVGAPATTPIPTNTTAPTFTPEPSSSAAATATPPGQPTATPAPTNTAAPSPQPPTATSAPQSASVVAQGMVQSDERVIYGFIVANPNPDLIVRDLRYQAIVYDQSGLVIGAEDGIVSVIGAGRQTAEAGSITLPDPALQAARAEVILGGGQMLQAVPVPPFTADNLNLLPGEDPVVTAILRNPYGQDLTDLAVVALIFGEGNRIVGAGTGTLAFLPASGQAAVTVPVEIGGTAQGIVLYANLDTLLNSP